MPSCEPGSPWIWPCGPPGPEERCGSGFAGGTIRNSAGDCRKWSSGRSDIFGEAAALDGCVTVKPGGAAHPGAIPLAARARMPATQSETAFTCLIEGAPEGATITLLVTQCAILRLALSAARLAGK